MKHDTINLEKYITELSSLFTFYRYSQIALTDSNFYSKIVQDESKTLYDTGKEFLIDPEKGVELLREHVLSQVPERVARDINTGLSVLRRQLLEAAYSIFEKFLCHVLRVYLYTFPKLLKGFDKKVNYRDIVDLKDNEPIFDFIVEKEIEHFGHRSLKEKKKYFSKRLHIEDDKNIWEHEGKELWEDIDKKRQAIVHYEETPEISFEYLSSVIFYFNRAMLGICMNAQAKQGIPFVFGPMPNIIKKRKEPKL